MSWRKHFKIVTDGSMSPVNGSTSNYSYGYLDSQANAAFRNYQSMLPDIYSGHPNRIDRYTQYENMDLDSEVNSALDILAEFCTQTAEDTQTAFDIHFHDEATENEMMILKEQLTSWYALNEFDSKIFNRNHYLFPKLLSIQIIFIFRIFNLVRLIRIKIIMFINLIM